MREKCPDTSGKSAKIAAVTRSTTMLPEGVIVPMALICWRYQPASFIISCMIYSETGFHFSGSCPVVPNDQVAFRRPACQHGTARLQSGEHVRAGIVLSHDDKRLI